jgi:hypothetical protein
MDMGKLINENIQRDQEKLRSAANYESKKEEIEKDINEKKIENQIEMVRMKLLKEFEESNVKYSFQAT